jgi:hypothetical protein
MKKLFLVALLTVGCVAPTWAQIPGRVIKEYTTKAGTTFRKGDTIQLARGLREDGSFRYAVIPLQPFHDPETSLPASWSRRKAVVSSVREIPYKTGRVVSLAFKAGAFTATLDPESAEETGEIITVANQQKATPSASGGVADELLKLKKLLDAGALTQAEFDAQKAKLLNR